MSQNPPLLAQRQFESVDERLSGVIARATAALVESAMAKAAAGAGFRITLSGNLGAGKTTWVRQFLRACGISGRIKSPSFSVVESYEQHGLVFHHLDFYRQSNPAAWQGGGLRDLLTEHAVVLMEWPEHAQGLPQAHIEIALAWQSEANAEAPRNMTLRFYEHHDGIALAPYLAQWDQAVRESEHCS